ncbi:MULTISPECIES: NAD(P)-dependent oxidoreductase [Mycolicibacterium]|uniref:6-phosphogluconate dehydrogenase n=1 Tax=Mycolicibacterium senegalense TaxID=1796 RepID=A0A378W9K0_9MYCO|nr:MULTISPECIES: NAD(P)-binding domain-containing protein [Mycolicibacterium]MCV7337330.1 NAD(P)-dependent oxidoreductase [Mycolicibacterium senegalense]MDR7287169.1 3-hydroxyisobutyrate dehydrogenase-like beta-hydroxyacid dehydrogenase [Mycolicibacterium senegalense]QZA24269.1 NAD(P)-binding domain-containing protein [Mycolicibacterium senegalense]CDP87812.1 6-phosphogluconate dehydrogenase [Mycolicibacterium farcinogenes]SUA29254.1 6-phosphogluconate dehydrogenase [Mycolicibacterium senegale
MSTTVSVLGLGPMGQALAGALVAANLRTTVWNRTAAKADGLLARGALWADTPARAAAVADLILVNVVDQAAADSVLAAAGDALAGRVIVGLSSDIPDSAHHTEDLVVARGGRYLDGAIMTPTDTIGTRNASILLAGPRDLFDAHRDVLEVLATVSWVGSDVGRAAAFDMALLDVFWTSISGFVHALAMAGAHGIAPTELLPHANNIAAILPPIFGEIAERVEADRHGDASASVSSVAASVRHLIAASGSAGLDAGALETFRGYVDAAVDAGYGADEISRIVPASVTMPSP